MPLILDPRWTSIPSLTSLRLQIAPGICTISGNTCVVYTVPATQPTQLSSIRVAARQRRSLGLRLHNRAEEGLNGSTSAAVHDPLATLTSYCVLHFDRVSQCCAILALLCVLSVLCPIIFDNARQLAHGAAGAVAEEVWQVRATAQCLLRPCPHPARPFLLYKNDSALASSIVRQVVSCE